MNEEIGTEATLFPEKEYILGIFVAVRRGILRKEIFFAFFLPWRKILCQLYLIIFRSVNVAQDSQLA
jgi:hypothetical protein